MALEVEYVKILEYRPATDDLLVRAGVGWKQGTVGHETFPAHLRSPPGRAYLTREPIRIHDIRLTGEFDYSDLLRDHGVTSLVNVPIAWEGCTYGVLEIDSRSYTDFQDDTIHFLHGFAQLLAVAIQRKQQEQEQEQEREVLFRELQHRIKNSLQMVSALLRLEQRKGDPSGFDRANEAVQAISLAYDQLQGSWEIRQVSLEEYLGKLCSRIISSLIGSRPVQVESKIDPVRVDFDKAVVLGLIANELVTNSVRQAFGEQEAGVIRVTLQVKGGEGFLAVEDDGQRASAGDRTKPGVVSRLLPAMARQLEGVLKFDTEHRPGTRHILRFPLSRQ
ncbi:sensor histidine kinase [Skermanella pratensis]|uniref:sensor histidine kinase n=1 Tax=Skermanella pratensis TaxID=2233999 RepID=UPI001FE33E6C|nr:histidine kinase dimerization/phosphoacceptor domain -containing protein [Skermanella pratensis]